MGNREWEIRFHSSPITHQRNSIEQQPQAVPSAYEHIGDADGLQGDDGALTEGLAVESQSQRSNPIPCTDRRDQTVACSRAGP